MQYTMNGWELLMTIIKTVFSHNCSVVLHNMYSADRSVVELPCMRSILYTWSYTIQTRAEANTMTRPTHVQITRDCSLLTSITLPNTRLHCVS